MGERGKKKWGVIHINRDIYTEREGRGIRETMGRDKRGLKGVRAQGRR